MQFTAHCGDIVVFFLDVSPSSEKNANLATNGSWRIRTCGFMLPPSGALGLLQSTLVNYDVVVPWLLQDPLQDTGLPPQLRANHTITSPDSCYGQENGLWSVKISLNPKGPMAELRHPLHVYL